MADICSCNICTSTLPGGRTPHVHDHMDVGGRGTPGAVAEEPGGTCIRSCDCLRNKQERLSQVVFYLVSYAVHANLFES